MESRTEDTRACETRADFLSEGGSVDYHIKNDEKGGMRQLKHRANAKNKVAQAAID